MITHTDTNVIRWAPGNKINPEKLIETSLPSSTNSLMKIRSMLSDFNVSGASISNAIAYHPALLARILRLANSPIYSPSKAISSIPMAINVMGTKVLSDIVTIEITTSAFKKIILNSTYAKRIWEHSLAVGFIARKFSEALKINDSEEVFTCGLLHDLGKMLLLNYGENQYAEVAGADNEDDALSLEKANYGYAHTELGALIARRWGLPENICYTILHHHDSTQANQCVMMICLIDIADMIANLKGYSLRHSNDSREFLPEIIACSPSAILLNLDEKTIIQNCDETLDKSLQEVIGTFS